MDGFYQPNMPPQAAPMNDRRSTWMSSGPSFRFMVPFSGSSSAASTFEEDGFGDLEGGQKLRIQKSWKNAFGVAVMILMVAGVTVGVIFGAGAGNSNDEGNGGAPGNNNFAPQALLFSERCQFHFQTFDKNGASPAPKTTFALGDDWKKLEWLGIVNADDQMEIEVTCNVTCTDCEENERADVESLSNICWEFGQSDRGSPTIQQHIGVCANSGKSRVQVTGNVGNDDSWFTTVFLNPSGNAEPTPMEDFLKTCFLHFRYADQNGTDGRTYGHISFQGTDGTSKPCFEDLGQASCSDAFDQRGFKWLKLLTSSTDSGFLGGSDNHYFRLRCGNVNAFPLEDGWEI